MKVSLQLHTQFVWSVSMFLEILLMFAKVFTVGGAICVIAQILINYTKIEPVKYWLYF